MFADWRIVGQDINDALLEFERTKSVK
jgi:uncharacterized membrane protein